MSNFNKNGNPRHWILIETFKKHLHQKVLIEEQMKTGRIRSFVCFVTVPQDLIHKKATYYMKLKLGEIWQNFKKKFTDGEFSFPTK